jgi:hypothetical protein
MVDDMASMWQIDMASIWQTMWDIFHMANDMELTWKVTWCLCGNRGHSHKGKHIPNKPTFLGTWHLCPNMTTCLRTFGVDVSCGSLGDVFEKLGINMANDLSHPYIKFY